MVVGVCVTQWFYDWIIDYLVESEFSVLILIDLFIDVVFVGVKYSHYLSCVSVLLHSVD